VSGMARWRDEKGCGNLLDLILFEFDILLCMKDKLKVNDWWLRFNY